MPGPSVFFGCFGFRDGLSVAVGGRTPAPSCRRLTLLVLRPAAVPTTPAWRSSPRSGGQSVPGQAWKGRESLEGDPDPTKRLRAIRWREAVWRSWSKIGSTLGRESADRLHDVTDESCAPIARGSQQHLVAGRLGSGDEVGAVSLELETKASRLLGTAVPLQVEEQLSLGRQQSAPAVGNRAALFAFAISALDSVFADPVVRLSSSRSRVAKARSTKNWLASSW